jgi:hypothetical protein
MAERQYDVEQCQPHGDRACGIQRRGVEPCAQIGVDLRLLPQKAPLLSGQPDRTSDATCSKVRQERGIS